MSRWFGSVVVMVITLLPVSALAQDAPAEPPATSTSPILSQSPAVSYDTVHLRNGGLYRGQVTEIVPGDHVTIIVDGGETKPLPWADIARIVAGTAPAGIKAPPVAPVAPTPAASPPRWPDATPPPASAAPPRMQWRANRPLLVTGAILFAAGYGPNLAVALPSTAGLVGRVVLLTLTLALPCLFNSNGYICEGQHGTVQLLIPFIGPFLFASDHPRDSVVNEAGSPLSPTAKGLLYTSAGLQIAGITSIFLALATGRHELPDAPAAQARSLSPSWSVTPLAAPGAVGVSFGVHRW